MTALSAFAGCGIELEYMIVDRESLSVRPIADHLLIDAAGTVMNELPRDGLGWSNELTLHLIEIKNSQPSADLPGLAPAFQSEVWEINRRLAAEGACLMPGGMHPWMDPVSETRLWPHRHAEIYRAYDTVFGCRQYGFANLQSMHVNLPFADDDQFARLHAAVRLVLPILPALAASSPVIDGRASGLMDNRLAAYCQHQARLPSTLGEVIPDSVASPAEYQSRILAPMYEEVAPLDPQGILRHEWLNARGVIPRFDRMALEIRLIDSQECPRADLAIAAAVVAVVREVYEEATADLHSQQTYPTAKLAELLQACIRDAEQTRIDDPDYLGLLGLPDTPCTAGAAWRQLIARWWQRDSGQATNWGAPLNLILEAGPLARRIVRALGPMPSRSRLQETWRTLCQCLSEGRPFVGRQA